ncbi:DUF2062 domain-containing protein [Acinetobacter qingfengensis]|uniref:DUF2062 domain-containing protein n=2 Tax=Acinetobacter qingfengensis TaxID=1262585 RepID=A0A1E7QWL4_9GAMM|nr:DUF2062 domain-containing protein [Acinetobacter qingfengensis]OEY91473.1 hypothetical protein BJI46_06985 [Acinetobacter qingfengensis]
MAKQFLQTWLPSHDKVASLKLMRLLGKHALNPLIWYINRHSIAKAVFIGTFFGLLPIPFHSVFIALFACIFEVNLPIGLTLAWLSNPLTIVPIIYLAFWFGTKIYHVNMINKDMILGVLHQIEHWIMNFGHGHIDFSLAKILISGLFIEAFIFAVLFYTVTLILWRLSVIRAWNKRNHSF